MGIMDFARAGNARAVSYRKKSTREQREREREMLMAPFVPIATHSMAGNFS